MARNRQRGRRRKRRPDEPDPDLTQPRHENVPGELEHASGDIEEFDAALISGAGGRPVDADGQPTDAEVDEPEAAGADEDEVLDEDSFEEIEDELDEEESDRQIREGERGAVGRRERRERRDIGGPRPGGNRVINFLRASWAELQRVQWPDRRQVAQATAVVLGFVVIAGAYLGFADWVAQQVVDFVI